MRCVKCRTVVHVQQMRRFMRNRSPANIRRTENQPPAIANRARAAATAPAAARIADAHRFQWQIVSARQLAGFGGQNVPRQRLHPPDRARAGGFGRSPQYQPVSRPDNPARGVRQPFEQHVAPFQWKARTRFQPRHRLPPRHLFCDPCFLTLRPDNRLAQIGAGRNGQANQARCGFDGQAVIATAGKAADVNGHGSAADRDRPITAPGRQCGSPDHQRVFRK